MPVPPTWIPRLAEILAAVQSLPSRDLDREQIMRLFGIKRRAALLLMKQLEPKMVRGSWRIDRSRLAAWLEEQMHDSDRELERQKRLTRALITADISLPRPPGAFLSVAATQEMRSQAVQGLPPGVSLAFGQSFAPGSRVSDARGTGGKADPGRPRPRPELRPLRFPARNRRQFLCSDRRGAGAAGCGVLQELEAVRNTFDSTCLTSCLR